MATGSIKKRSDRPTNPYQVIVREYPNGPQRSMGSFTRKTDAQRHLTKILHDMETGDFLDPDKGNTTVQEFYETWAARKSKSWRPKTQNLVASSFKVHILPKWGPRPLGTIRSEGEMEDFTAGLDLAPSSVELVLRHFSSFLDAAGRDGYMRGNPLKGVRRPPNHKEPITPFTPEELRAFKEAAPPWFAVAVTLGAWCGLRQSEVTGLTLDRLNFLGRSLKVDRQLVSSRGPDGLVTSFGPPKTKNSYRDVPLDDDTLGVLAAHIKSFGTGKHGLVLHEGGEAVGIDRFNDLWDFTRRGTALPKARFHRARHTYASALLSQRLSVAAVARYLGDTPVVVMRIYAHLMPQDDDFAREAIRRALPHQAVYPVCTKEAGREAV
jgi:integrase